ncbi:MAG: type II secretion system protein [Smithellaceae bacterium]|nr:type II secretion system protein [Smithellaceae bacterium]
MRLSKEGFTLIEVIVTLILVGIMAAALGMGLVHVVKGFVFTKLTTSTLQKGQLAMSRISMELNNISLVSSPSTDTTITFYSYKNDVKKRRTIRWTGDKIEIDDGDGIFKALTDQVATTNGFELKYYANYSDTIPCYPSSAKIVVVTLRMVGADGHIMELVERTTPRNI